MSKNGFLVREEERKSQPAQEQRWGRRGSKRGRGWDRRGDEPWGLGGPCAGPGPGDAKAHAVTPDVTVGNF